MPAPAGPIAGFLHHLSQDGLTDLSDGDLLARFVRGRDEAAFAQLLRRHGPMVLGAARRVLGNATDAEDVTQAVFLILARQAGRFTGMPNVGGWLHGVAVQTALHAKSRRHRRRVVEARAARPEAVAGVSGDDLATVIDRAVQSLPAKLRDAVVLCDLEGQSRQQAANRLGVPLGTVSSRLAAAHAKLAAKLARPFAGAALVGVGMADGLAGATLAAVFTHDPWGVPAGVSVLVMEVTRMMWITKVKLAAAGVVMALAVGASGVGAGRYAAADEPKGAAAKPNPPPKKVEDSASIQMKRDRLDKSETDKFEGTWRFVSAATDGTPEPLGVYLLTMRIEFAQVGQCIIRDTEPTRFQGVGYRINPYRTPKELFFFERLGAYIYEFDGDMLRLGKLYTSGFDRPHGFTKTDQPPDSPSVTVYVLKREKPPAK